MSKAVLLSVQPYWVFLIIAKAMGWNIDIAKTIEVRKSCPRAEDWNKTVKIYCSNNKKSFARIPKKYQPLMQPLLGKVVGEFVCDEIYDIGYSPYNHGGFISNTDNLHEKSCLDLEQMFNYLSQGYGYGWHISDLVIYDKPKELSEFIKPCIYGDESDVGCFSCDKSGYRPDGHIDCFNAVTRPPQSWCYVEVTK